MDHFYKRNEDYVHPWTTTLRQGNGYVHRSNNYYYLDVTKDAEENRKAKRVKIVHIHDKTKDTLQGNLCQFVHPESKLQTDGHRSYCGLDDSFESHDVVVHDHAYVTRNSMGDKVTTNTIEGVHGAIKWQGRKSRLVRGSGSQGILLQDKVLL
jgi:hypothetical protein